MVFGCCFGTMDLENSCVESRMWEVHPEKRNAGGGNSWKKKPRKRLGDSCF